MEITLKDYVLALLVILYVIACSLIVGILN